MEITINVVREKIRKKMLYIATVFGILIAALFSSDMGSITIGGRDIKDYYILVPILINVINFVAGALALAMSVTTIPGEYERKTSHLIWSRGIRQSKYHMELATGSVIVSWISGAIMYLALGVFAVINGYGDILFRIVLSIPFMMIYTAIICMLTSALSIKIPMIFNCAIMILILVFGAFRSVITLMVSVLTGIGGAFVKRLILLIPDLSGISSQAGNLIQGKAINVHVIITGLFVIWFAGLLIMVVKREEV